MKTYIRPEIEITNVALGLFMVSPNTVNTSRDGFDPSGGAMTNGSIWDDSAGDTDAE